MERPLQKLATPALEKNFDPEKLKMFELQNSIIEKLEGENGNAIEHVSTEDVIKAIRKLKSERPQTRMEYLQSTINLQQKN